MFSFSILISFSIVATMTTLRAMRAVTMKMMMTRMMMNRMMMTRMMMTRMMMTRKMMTRMMMTRMMTARMMIKLSAHALAIGKSSLMMAERDSLRTKKKLSGKILMTRPSLCSPD